jgi:uncharacterized SAM-binding protein YcdF (DUF218 family)
MQLGIPADRIVVETDSQNTYENALYSRALLQQRSVETIALVTDATHLPRAVACFEKQGFVVIPVGCRYQSPIVWSSVRSYLPDAEAAADTQYAIQEWLGLVWYRMRDRV